MKAIYNNQIYNRAVLPAPGNVMTSDKMYLYLSKDWFFSAWKE